MCSTLTTARRSLNAGSYQGIPLKIRASVYREFEKFVYESISSGTSFGLEATLRSTVTFEQAKLAKQQGFRVFMRYIALDNVEHHIERVRRRAACGGHAASETTLREIHDRSLANLPIALDPELSGIEIVRIYDNSRFEEDPTLILAARSGRIVRLRDSVPDWLVRALGWTRPDLDPRLS